MVNLPSSFLSLPPVLGGGIIDKIGDLLNPPPGAFPGGIGGISGGLGDLINDGVNPPGSGGGLGGIIGDLIDDAANPPGGGGLGGIIGDLIVDVQPPSGNGGGLGDLLRPGLVEGSGDSGNTLRAAFPDYNRQPLV